MEASLATTSVIRPERMLSRLHLVLQRDSQIALGTVSRAVCSSGSYDLEEPMLSARVAYLQLSRAEVDTFSSVRHMKRIGFPMVVSCGTSKTDGHCRHAKALRMPS